jgi:sodium-coupled neutral amino acid transporter 11
LALGGYLAFTDQTSANILNNFPSTNTVMNISRVLFGINMFLTFPMECFVCREVIFHYLWGHLYHPEADINHLTSPWVHIGTTLLLVFSAMFISLVSCDLGFLLEITVDVIN